MAELTAERLRELLHYDPETGEFRRKSQRSKYGTTAPVRPSIANRNAGHFGDQRYRLVSVDGKAYRAHRLAWLYVHDRWPTKFIDHINGDRGDNRIMNLREVDNSLNMQNLKGARVDSSSGLLGAHWDAARRKYSAEIKAGGRKRFLGRYDTPQEAHQAYLAAKRRLHEGCTI